MHNYCKLCDHLGPFEKYFKIETNINYISSFASIPHFVVKTNVSIYSIRT